MRQVANNMNMAIRGLIFNALLVHGVYCVPCAVDTVNAQDLKASQVTRVSNSLLEFQENCLGIDCSIVYCEGRITTLETKGTLRATENPFIFIGVADHKNRQCRWICRSETPDPLSEEGVRMEHEFLQLKGGSRIWTNGVEQLYDEKGDKRSQLLANLKGNVIRFHPLPISLAGYGGLVTDHYRRARQQFPHFDMKKLKSVNLVGSEVTANWETPSSNNGSAIRRVTFDEARGHAPTRVQQLYLPPGAKGEDTNFVLYESTNEWAKSEKGVWLPEQMNMTRWYGGRLHPSKVVYVHTKFSWDLSLDDLSAFFRLVENDVNRPAWTPEIRSLLGEPHRMPAEFVIANTNTGVE